MSPARIVIAATVVGLVTGFFGVGGGFVVVPALVLALGFDMPTAVGTSLLVIAINSASSLLSRLGTHVSVGYALVITFTVAAVAGTLVGSRVASKGQARAPGRRLRRAHDRGRRLHRRAQRPRAGVAPGVRSLAPAALPRRPTGGEAGPPPR